jgi:E1A-binding protein p400
VERFDVVSNVASRRTPTVKPVLVNPTLRNPKHAAVLAETGISYDAPLSPVEVAQRRAERIIKLKATNVSIAYIKYY